MDCFLQRCSVGRTVAWGLRYERDKALKRFFEAFYRGKFFECFLALLSAGQKDGNALEHEIIEKRFPPVSQRGSMDCEEDPAKSEKNTYKAAWERPETAEFVLHLMPSDIFRHLRDLLQNSKLFFLEKHRMSDWIAVEQFRFMASLTQVFATFGDEASHSLPAERLAMSSVEVGGLDDGGDDVPEGPSFGFELRLDEDLSLIYLRVEEPALEAGEAGSEKRRLFVNSTDWKRVKKKRDNQRRRQKSQSTGS